MLVALSISETDLMISSFLAACLELWLCVDIWLWYKQTEVVQKLQKTGPPLTLLAFFVFVLSQVIFLRGRILGSTDTENA